MKIVNEVVSCQVTEKVERQPFAWWMVCRSLRVQARLVSCAEQLYNGGPEPRRDCVLAGT